MVSQRRGEEHKTTGWQRKRYTPGGPALDNDDAAINLLSENTALCAVFFFSHSMHLTMNVTFC